MHIFCAVLETKDLHDHEYHCFYSLGVIINTFIQATQRKEMSVERKEIELGEKEEEVNEFESIWNEWKSIKNREDELIVKLFKEYERLLVENKSLKNQVEMAKK